MASRPNSSIFLPIGKLIGRQNYRAWSVAMRAYLDIEDFWDTVEAPEGEQLPTDVKKIQKARGRIILAVEPDAYAYIEDMKTAKDAWEALAKTFDDKGATHKVSLLSGQDVTADLVKTKLLEELEKVASGNDSQNFGFQAQALPAHFSAPNSYNRGRRG